MGGSAIWVGKHRPQFILPLHLEIFGLISRYEFRRSQRERWEMSAEERFIATGARLTSLLNDFSDAVGVNAHRLGRAEVNDDPVVARCADISGFAEGVARAVVQTDCEWSER